MEKSRGGWRNVSSLCFMKLAWQTGSMRAWSNVVVSHDARDLEVEDGGWAEAGERGDVGEGLDVFGAGGALLAGRLRDA